MRPLPICFTLTILQTIHAFVIQPSSLVSVETHLHKQKNSPARSYDVSLALANEETTASKRGRLDPEVRSRLLSESIAPWRTLRIFLYVSLGSGAFLGGLITASGVAAALSGVRTDLDLNTEYTSLAIDFGAAVAFGIFTKLDFDKGNELDEKVEKRLEKSKENKVIRKAMKVREKELAKLELEIKVDGEGTTQQAVVEAIQGGGKQHMIVVAGGRKAIRDALLGANILKMEFSIRDVLVVPYELNKPKKKKVKDGEDVLTTKAEGFGDPNASRPTWETQPYVAQAVGEGWDSYIQAELDDAIKQNGENVKEDGIAIVVANTGEIIRRGVGQVPWREMVEELENVVKDDELLDLSFLGTQDYL